MGFLGGLVLTESPTPYSQPPNAVVTAILQYVLVLHWVSLSGGNRKIISSDRSACNSYIAPVSISYVMLHDHPGEGLQHWGPVGAKAMSPGDD